MKNDSSDSSQVDQWNLSPLDLVLFFFFVWLFCCVRGGGRGEGGKKGGNGVCKSLRNVLG